MRKILILLLFLHQLNFLAQNKKQYTDNSNGWYMYFGSHKLSGKWGIHLEAQLRRNEIITKPQQLLLRTGINYHFNKKLFATVGYCYVITYPYGEFPSKTVFPENRIWEQIQLKNQIGKLELVNRFRLEQRFVNSPIAKDSGFVNGPAVYTDRFRLLNRFSIPLKGKEILDKSFYISFYDEVFINFGHNLAKNIFDQNRAYIALGYKIPKVGRIEIGYLNQLIFKSDGIKVENNHTLQIGLSSTIDLYKKKD
jgi:hypothetical protein